MARRSALIANEIDHPIHIVRQYAHSRGKQSLVKCVCQACLPESLLDGLVRQQVESAAQLDMRKSA